VRTHRWIPLSSSAKSQAYYAITSPTDVLKKCQYSGGGSPRATSAPAAAALIVTAIIAPVLAAPMMAIPAPMMAIIVLNVVDHGGQHGGAYNQTQRGRHVFIVRA